VLVPVVSAVLAAASPAVGSDGSERAVKKELKKLEGVWALKERTINGKESPKESLKAEPGMEIKGDSVKMGLVEFKIVIDPSQKPKTIDRLIKAPDGRGIKSQGIYELDGDTLKMCVPTPLRKRGRPKELMSGDGVIMSVYERKKE
jgi:uncharacterized protein (TIGR03067 family)